MIVNSAQRGISAYKIGCDPALHPFKEDENDEGTYDFSNDVIARAKYFEKHVF